MMISAHVLILLTEFRKRQDHTMQCVFISFIREHIHGLIYLISRNSNANPSLLYLYKSLLVGDDLA